MYGSARHARWVLRRVVYTEEGTPQLGLGLGLEPAGGGPLLITSSRMEHLMDALEHAYLMLGWKTRRAGTTCSATW